MGEIRGGRKGVFWAGREVFWNGRGCFGPEDTMSVPKAPPEIPGDPLGGGDVWGGKGCVLGKKGLLWTGRFFFVLDRKPPFPIPPGVSKGPGGLGVLGGGLLERGGRLSSGGYRFRGVFCKFGGSFGVVGAYFWRIVERFGAPPRCCGPDSGADRLPGGSEVRVILLVFGVIAIRNCLRIL